MQRVLSKRILRDLKSNFLRYMALCFMVAFSLFLIVSLIGCADNIIDKENKSDKEHFIEDGEFTVFAPLSDDDVKKITDDGTTLAKQFNLDVTDADKTLRFFKIRKEINKEVYIEGEKPKNENEIALERRYSEENSINVNDRYKFAGKEYTVSGIVALPDYNTVVKKLTDTNSNNKKFGLAIVVDKEYERIKNEGLAEKSEEYNYAYRLTGSRNSKDVKKILKDLKPENLTSFLKKEDNNRIGASADDQVINKYGGIVAGIILIILFAYVMSVFVIHSIEEDATVIGALYSLGLKRRELMKHFIVLPVVVVLVGGIIGCALSLSPIGMEFQSSDSYSYYSMPNIRMDFPPYLFVYGVILPPILTALVNYILIRKKLSMPALKLLRNEHTEKKGKNLELNNMGFIKAFQIRQLLKEGRSALAVVIGMFICLTLSMMSINCYYLCSHIKENNVKDTKYEYMYTLKYPTDEVPKGGEEALIKTFKKDARGYTFDVSVLGVKDSSKYFDVDTTKDDSMHVVISSAVATKFLVKKGDELTVRDEENDRLYSFVVSDVYDYSPSFMIFMDIDKARELFNEEEDYYNVVFADKELNIDSGRIYSTLTKKQIKSAADIYVDLMQSFIVMIAGGSLLIFFIVMYLMIKVMVDRSAFSIAMVKIFGYRKKEIKKLYINGNFYVVAIGALICIPCAKMIMDKMYPTLCANFGGALDLTFEPWTYIIIYAVVMLTYFVISTILVRRIDKVKPIEVLKNRE
ncbi:ABC transporter permease [Eubacterium sp.]|uniref:ABC transporter permease n=1 Tax=Eubacterium sp. TaxID=142586 RepID=UPI0025F95929|nr:ABC transporter permease [Eubacterium sp.]MCR5628553.1 ABC transporter permease [Eubacterium sp.]